MSSILEYYKTKLKEAIGYHHEADILLLQSAIKDHENGMSKKEPVEADFIEFERMKSMKLTQEHYEKVIKALNDKLPTADDFNHPLILNRIREYEYKLNQQKKLISKYE